MPLKPFDFSNMEAIGLILAGGRGSRMKTSLPKSLVSLNGKPIISHIIEALRDAGVKNIAIVIGHKGEEIKKKIGDGFRYVVQPEPKGTAHAVMQIEKNISWGGKDIFIFVGDSPLIRPNTIRELFFHHHATQAHCTFLTAEFSVKLPYARVIRDNDGRVLKCVEEKNANENELKIQELLSSHFVFKADSLFRYLHEIPADPDNGEFYLTEIVNIFLAKGLSVETLKITNYQELIGVNTPEDLAWAERILSEGIYGRV